jgi:hypothetical protein
VVEKPLDVTTRTGMSTGNRSQRRVFPEFGILEDSHLRHAIVQITKVIAQPPLVP